jgi:hypothetical protein
MWYIYRRDVCTEFRWGNLSETDHLQDPSTNGRIMLSSRMGGGGDWTGLIWLNTGTSGKLL